MPKPSLIKDNKSICHNANAKEYPASKAIIPRYSSQKCFLHHKNNIRIAKGDKENNIQQKEAIPKQSISHHKSNSFFNNQSHMYDITFKTSHHNDELNKSSHLKKKVKILPVQFNNIREFNLNLNKDSKRNRDRERERDEIKSKKEEEEMKRTAVFNDELNNASIVKDRDKLNKKRMARYQSGTNIFNMNSNYNNSNNNSNSKCNSNQLIKSKSIANTPKIMKRHPILKNMFN